MISNPLFKFIFSILLKFQVLSFLFLMMLSACNLFKKQHKIEKAPQELNPKIVKEKNSPADSIVKNITGAYDTFPVRLDLRPFQTSVKNQGSRSTCSYFTFCALLESYFKIKFGKEYNLSEEYLIGINQKNTYGLIENCSADFPEIAYRNYGIVTEDRWPYQPSWYSYGFPYYPYRNLDSVPAKELKSNRMPDYKKEKPVIFEMNSMFRAATGVRKALQALSKDSLPFIATLILTTDQYLHCDSFNGKPFKTTFNYQKNVNLKTGEFKFEVPAIYKIVGKDTFFIKEIEENKWDNHFVLVTGYDREEEVFYFKNSWDSTFGDQGYGFIRFSQFRRRLRYFIKLAPNLNLPLPAEPLEIPKKVTVNNVKININQDPSKNLEIKLEADIKGIGNHNLLIKQTLCSYSDSSHVEKDSAKPIILSTTDSILLGDKYLRCAWHTPFETIGTDLLWPHQNPLTMQLNLAQTQPMMKQIQQQNKKLVLRTTFTMFNDLQNEVELMRVWTPVPMLE